MTAGGPQGSSSGAVHVLLVEDDPGDARLVREALRGPGGADFTLDHVTRLDEALGRLAAGGIDAVLLDLTLPDSDGLDTVDRLGEHVNAAAVVVLTGLDDDTTGRLAIERGAQDYLVKGEVDERTLPRTLRYAVERDRSLRRLRGLLAEQKQATEALRHSQERYHTVADAALDAMLIADVAGSIVSWNPAAQRLFGHSHDDARNLHLADLLPVSNRDQLLDAMRHLERTGELIAPLQRTVEMPALQADGRVRLTEWSISTWRDDVGRFFTATVRDISDRQEARLLTELVQAQHDITDAGFDQSLVVSVTARWAMSLTDANGAGIYTLNGPDLPRRQAAVGSLTMTDPNLGAKTTATVQLQTADDSRAVLAIDAPADDGYHERRHEMLEVVAGFCDAALARAREFAAKQALLEEQTTMLAVSSAQEQRFRRAFDDAPVSVALVGLQHTDCGRLLRANTALHVLLGQTEDLAGGEVHLTDLAHPEDRPAIVAAVERLTDGAQTASFTARLAVTDGSYRHVEGVIAAVRPADTSKPYGIVQLADVTATYQAQRELRRLALHDPLTGLPNRRLLTDRLTQELRRSQRSQRPVAVMFIDLDGFKPVNDRHGHHAGDRVLQEVARRIVDNIRDSDTAARIGGDEFVVVCEGIDADTRAYELAERLRERIRSSYDLDGLSASITASIGVALADAADTPERALQAADHAMYQAKQAGGDRCIMAALAPAH